MTEDLDDFEVLLSPGFSATQFCNDLLKTTNRQPGASELDLETPMKKIRYDLDEVESRIEETIKRSPAHVVDQIYKSKSLKEVAENNLKSSLEYLDISYKRLQNEVLEPYERAQILQSVLSKVHQTSLLLRDGAIYIHLAGRIQSIAGKQKPYSVSTSLELVNCYNQINMSMGENANLRSLKLIKELETDVVVPVRKELLSHLSLTLSRVLANSEQIQRHQDDISNLSRALHSMSRRDFVSTIQKTLLAYVTAASQALIRTINSIKDFPTALEEAVRKSQSIDTIEFILREVKVEKTNLLAEYAAEVKPKYTKSHHFFWKKVSEVFKREFETSFNRGGPIGKSLARNQDMIINTIKEKMTEVTNGDGDTQDVEVMLQSVSVFNPEEEAK